MSDRGADGTARGAGASAAVPAPDHPRTVLFWDIDGTLLSTARAGVFALEDAAEALLGRRPDYSTLETAGLTDHAIAALALRSRPPGSPTTRSPPSRSSARGETPPRRRSTRS